jgi:hypothetical protein
MKTSSDLTLSVKDAYLTLSKAIGTLDLNLTPSLLKP